MRRCKKRQERAQGAKKKRKYETRSRERCKIAGRRKKGEEKQDGEQVQTEVRKRRIKRRGKR